MEEIRPHDPDDDIAASSDPVLAFLLSEERFRPAVGVLHLAVELEQDIGALDAEVDPGDEVSVDFLDR